MLIKDDKNLRNSYSFTADPYFSKWYNTKKILTNMSSQKYFNRIKNMAYHNLCKSSTPPENLGLLLGLSLKFCIQSRRPPKEPIKEEVDRMRRDVRIKFLFCGEEQEDNYNPKLYIKSDWDPPVANNIIE